MKEDEVTFGNEFTVKDIRGKFSDKYTKIQELGFGAFAKVYRVENKETKKIYACKELVQKRIVDIERFKSEISIMSKCNHPNIVNLYEVYRNARYLDLVMEECSGGSLFDRILAKIDEGESFTEKEACVIFKQIISAVNYCHSQGICHRDLKPENVLFLNSRKDSPVKITDFGLGLLFSHPSIKKVSPDKAYMTSILGTTNYMSPEVLKGNYTPKCDIWSCGVILYMLLSGCYPFDGDTDEELKKEILKQKVEYPKEEWENVSKEAIDLINHMLCNEKNRYTAEKVLNHPWITSNAKRSFNALSGLNIKNLKIHKGRSQFKRFSLYYLASRLDEKDFRNLRNIFFEIDSNGDGLITLKELKDALCALKDENGAVLSDNDIKEIFYGIDANNSERISINELVAALMEQSNYLQEEKLIDAFNNLDKDGSGKLTKEEIRLALNNNKISDRALRKFIQSFDFDGDGEIDIMEFLCGLCKD